MKFMALASKALHDRALMLSEKIVIVQTHTILLRTSRPRNAASSVISRSWSTHGEGWIAKSFLGLHSTIKHRT